MYIIVAYNTTTSSIGSIMRGDDHSGVDTSLANMEYYTITEQEASGDAASIAALYAGKSAADKLAVLKLAKKAQVSAQRLKTEQAGVDFPFYDGTGNVQTDQTSIRNIQSLVTNAMISKNLGDDSRQYGFRDTSDVTHAMTASEVINLGLSTTNFINWTYVTSWNKKAAIDALADAASVRAYDVTAGWTYTPTTVTTGNAAMGNKPNAKNTNTTTTSPSDKFNVYSGTSDGTETLFAATGSGRMVIFKNNTSFIWTITANAGDTIDGQASISFKSPSSLTLVDSAAGKWSVV